MACMGSSWGCLAAQFPSIQIAWKDFERSDKFLNAAYPVLERFWQRVERREPPDIGDLPSGLEVVKTMYPEETGEEIELSEDIAPLVRELETIKTESSQLNKRKKEIETKIRFAMGEATFARVPGFEKILTLKTTHTKGYTKVVEPGSFRVLRIANKK